MKPLISVIIPVYNVELYLRRCLDSVINQTYKKLEIIVVNDGSTDDSLNICKEYEQKDKRVILIDQKNGGLSDARNKGINVAKGEYIAFLDSDDFYDLNLFNDFAKKFKNIKCDIFIFKALKCFDLSNNISFAKNKEIEKITNIECMKRILSNELDNFAVNKIYNKKIMKNIQFPIGKNFEDIGTIYKYVLNSSEIYVTSSEYYGYYQRNNSITNSMKACDIINRLNFSIERYEYIKKEYRELETIVLKDLMFQIYRCHLDCCKYLNDKRKTYDSLELKSAYNIYKNNYNNDMIHESLSFVLFINRNVFYLLARIYIKIKKLKEKI